MAGIPLPNGDGIFKEKGKGRMSVDENDVRKVQSTLSNWVNPFLKSDSDELCHIENGETTIIIKSPDTDVAILACHFCRDISARILIMKKEKTRNIYLETSAIADAAGPHLCDALPGLHAFTSCDSTSAFAGKGKKTGLKLCKTDPVQWYGDSWAFI